MQKPATVHDLVFAFFATSPPSPRSIPPGMNFTYRPDCRRSIPKVNDERRLHLPWPRPQNSEQATVVLGARRGDKAPSRVTVVWNVQVDSRLGIGDAVCALSIGDETTDSPAVSRIVAGMEGVPARHDLPTPPQSVTSRRQALIGPDLSGLADGSRTRST